jgi:hypothetical protein
MTLADLTLPMAFEDCRGLALLYAQPAAEVLYELQQMHGDWRHVSYGQPLTDGRWMLGGSILSEVGPDGIYAWVAEHTPDALKAEIEVVPLADALALLPPPEPE